MHTLESTRLREAGLNYVSVDSLSVFRRRCGRGFTYIDEAGRRVRDEATLQRIRALAIPPAYTDVRIAADADQHIQAVGCDDAGRLQYIYHAGWEQVREARKTDRLAALCDVLPALRRRLQRSLRKSGAGYDKALAAVVSLIDRTHIRVGCSDYVHSGRSRGAATLLKQNVRCEGDYIHLAFRGKRQLAVRCTLYAPALARTLEELRQIPGQRMFQYLDDDGARRRISARDVNAYLFEITGEKVTAKDFRTLAATAAAAKKFCALEPADSARQRQRQVKQVMNEVAELLANTPAVVRRSYVHGSLVEAFEQGELARLCRSARKLPELSHGESLVERLLRRRGNGA